MNNYKKKILRMLFIGGYIYCLIAFAFPNSVIADEIVKETSAKSREMYPFYWMIIIVGGCIGITLTYVGWRKCKAEKNKKKDKGKSID